jgi:outer membrane protein insertion porin family
VPCTSDFKVRYSESFLPTCRLLLLGLVLLGVPVDLSAQETAGTQDADARPAVESVDLLGLEHLKAGDVEKILATRSSSWLPWADPKRLDRDELALDLKRIVAYCRDHGFPDAEIVSHDVTLTDEGRKAHVTVRIDEGTPLLVKAVELDGFEVLTDDERQALRDRMPVAIGEPVVRADVLAGGEMASAALKDRGYAAATVRVFEERENGQSLVRYAAEPGPVAYFGPIEIDGNKSVDDNVIRRKLTFRPGDRFSQKALRESQQRLYGLRLFRFANIKPLLEETKSSEVPTRISVAEGKHRQVEFSAGYGTEEKLRGEAQWRHLNFLGGARILGLHGRWSALNRGGQIDFEQPYFFHPRLSLALDGHSWYTDEPAYAVLAQGGGVAVNGFINSRTQVAGAFTTEYQRSTIAEEALADPSYRDDLIALGLDPDTGEQDGTLVSVGASFIRNTTVNPLDPRDGYQFSAKVEQAGGWLPGSYNFIDTGIDGRIYRTVGDRTTLAGRVRAASIAPFGPASDVPFSRRYFLGGSTSLRGWGRFEVAPLSPTGLPVGGNTMLDTSAELRMRLVGNFGAIAFVDAGNVWTDAWQFELNDLLYDVGAGLRYYTPIGPIRLDYAWQLTPIDGLLIDGKPQDRRWRIHVSIGQAF